MKLNRRKFMRTCGLAVAGLAGTSALHLLQGCQAPRAVAYRQEGDTLVLSLGTFAEIDHAVIRHPDAPAGVFVARLKDNRFSAVLLKCSHRGCDVSPAGDLLICPCHGSEYTRTGVVVSPPAPFDLYRFPVTTDENNLYITLK